MKIGFTFTNYNNSQYTLKCVKSISDNLPSDKFQIVIVDNCSNHDDQLSLKDIANNFKNVTIILNPENIGYFKGLNIGISKLKKSSFVPDYIVIGNNDLVFEQSFYQEMLHNLEVLERYAVVAPNIVTIDGVHQNPHVIKRISPFREFMYDLYYSNYYLSVGIAYLARLTKTVTDRSDEDQHEIGQVIYQGYGACYILCGKFFNKFNELWAPTFLMGEELFLSLQLSRANEMIYYEPSIHVLHHDHASVGKLPSKYFWKISKESHKEYRKHVKIFSSKL